MRQRGSVFLLTLAVMAGLVALVATLAIANREYTRSQTDRMALRRAELMVEAGVQRAAAELQSQDPAKVTKSDKWASLGDTGETQFVVGNDSFRIQVLDASARLNLNTADEASLKELSLTPEQIASLLDWREDKRSPRAEGAKDEFYNRLNNPYNTKLKSLDSLDELLLIRGFTPASLYTAETPLADAATTDSQSADKDIAGKQKLDLNTATADKLTAIGVPQDLATAILQARGKGFKSLGEALKVSNMTRQAARAIADNTTIGTDKQHAGLININTAPAKVLETIKGITPDIAASIVGRQSSGFRSLGDLVDVPGMELTVLAATLDRFCVGSRTFIVRVMGAAAGIRTAAEATLSIQDDGQVKILRVQKQYYPLVRERWGWPERASRQVLLGVTQ